MKMDANVKGTDLYAGPKDVTQSGTYHCVILKVREITRNDGSVSDKLELEVLNGTEPNQTGNRAECWLNRCDGVGDAQWSESYQRWAWATKLLEPGGPEIEFNPNMMEGLEVVCSIFVNEKNKSARVSGYSCDVWRVDSPEVATVPKSKVDALGEVKPESGENLDGIFG